MTQHPSSFAKRLGMALVAAGLLSLYSGSLSAQRSAPSLPKADAWSSMHLLNRISFGPRPGDLERVQKMGLAAYIEEQLHPEKIDNAALDTRLSGFTTLAMDSQDITEKFIQPAQQLQRQRQQAQGQAERLGERGSMVRHTEIRPVLGKKGKAFIGGVPRMIQKGHLPPGSKAWYPSCVLERPRENPSFQVDRFVRRSES